MSSPPPPLSQQAEASIKGILEWLALAHGRTGSGDAEQALKQAIQLRDAPIPPVQRVKLLDMLYGHAERIAKFELPQLQAISLPLSRKLRQRTKLITDLLEAIAQDYFNTLSELFDPELSRPTRAPHQSLRRAMHALSWQIRISHLIASPPGAGAWQRLHSAFRTARRLGQEDIPGTGDGASIRRAYTDILLAAIAQPASFSSNELEFIREYIEGSPLTVELLDTPPPDGRGIFWIDLERDFPAHALIRRQPTPGAQILYFSCDAMAESASRHRAQLAKGIPAASLGIPDFAETRAGQGTLDRLVMLWGCPAKRKFPRRRQSYRANLCLGLDNLWKLIKTPESRIQLSEWMVTNESPDGYALMHMSGHTENLRIGDVVALQALDEHAEVAPAWHVCIIRWALSENPEHVELGLELLAARAIPAEIAQPRELDAGSIVALLLPETPPLRLVESLVLPFGALRDKNARMVLMVEGQNLEVREVRATSLNEQTSSIEVFNVLTDDSP